MEGYRTFWFTVFKVNFRSHLCYNLTYSWEDKRVHAFYKSISPKVNVIARQEFDLVNYDVDVQHISHYCTFLFWLVSTFLHKQWTPSCVLYFISMMYLSKFNSECFLK